MMLNDFKDSWDKVSFSNGELSLRRVNSVHPLDIYFGYDEIGNREFVFLTSIKPDLSIKSTSISIDVGLRKDNRYVVCFKLTEKEQEAVFIQLCWDLFEYTKNSNDDSKGIYLIQKRFGIWQRLLKKKKEDFLSVQAIRGLIGELLFLKNIAFERYGVNEAIKGWIGTSGADKDFVYTDFWYEIKTIDPSAKEIIISSLEQLESNHEGYLVTVQISQTSEIDSNRTTLTNLVNDIRNILISENESTYLFESKLIEIGYVDRKEYDEYSVLFGGFKEYRVNDTFPKLLRESVDISITEVEYKISIASIKEWLTV